MPFSYNSFKRHTLKKNSNANSKIIQKNINSRIINNENNSKNKKTKINYNLTSTNPAKNKKKDSINSHKNLSINTNNFYSSRPKYHKPTIAKNKKHFNNNISNRQLTNDIIYTDSCINSNNNRKNFNNENFKSVQNNNNNKIIINLNILKPKIFVDKEKKYKKK